MVRTRIPEASLVGLLAALATFCALEARGGQPYSIVGQSGPATAATGRRPLAERIKAANRPIRIASEEELAPDEGLIPALQDPAAEVREWTPGPAVVEFPAGGPAAIAVDEPAEADEPGVMPPPESTAVAARPTTAEDAGLVGEASSIDTAAEADVATADPTTEEAARTEEASPPGPLPQAPRQVARVSPPRRSAPRVTPQRREALLDRLRTALAEVPRPLGLIPAPPRPQASARRPSAAPRSAVARQPVPATSLPEPLTAQPAATPTEVPSAGDALAEETVTPPVDGESSESHLAGVAESGADSGAAPAVEESEPESPTEAAASAAVTESTTPTTEPAVEAIADVGPADEPVATPVGPAAAETTDAGAVADPGTLPTEAVAEAPAVRRPEPAVQGQPRRQVHHQRPRATSVPQPAMTPLDRLQARLENMPRALGLVPAPRPSMHAHQPPRRRPAQAAPVAPAAPGAVAATSEPAAVAETRATAEPESTVAPTDAVAADESDAPDAAPAAPTVTADVEPEPSGDAGPSLTVTTSPSEEASPTTEDRDPLEVAEGDEVAATSPTETGVDGSGDLAPGLVDDPSSVVASTTEESTVPAPVAEPAPVGDTVPATPAVRTPPRQPARRTPPPVARRPLRDALETALANMPRPLGLLPQPEPAAPRRSVKGPSNGPTAPRALATKSIGTRPLDTASGNEPNVSRAIVAAPPTGAGAEADDTTLTSGNDATESAAPVAPLSTDGAPAAETAHEPATLPELPDAGDVVEAPAAHIEVTVSGPEGSTPLGERVTLRLTVRNTGSAVATAVTPVVHFGLGLEPLGIRGRHGNFTTDGSVMFDRVAELPPGESVEVEIIAVCTSSGTIHYQGAAWCGDGEDRDVIPADASVDVAPAAVASEPLPLRRR